MLENHMNRREVVSILCSKRENLLIVSGLGSPTYDVHAAGDSDKNFYLWGAMGGAAMMGLGLSLARPDNSVLVITGDGEQLMGLGALATIAVQKPINLTIAVLDNEHFGETGMQKSHTGQAVSLTGVAKASGFPIALDLTTMSDVIKCHKKLLSNENLTFLNIKVSNQQVKRSLPLLDGVEIKNRFKRSLEIT